MVWIVLIKGTGRTESMRNISALAFALLLAWHAAVLAQDFRPIDNPEKFAADVVRTIANGALNDAAKTMAEAIGQPALVTTVQSALQIFDGKKFDFSKKVIDNEIAGALREIIHYSYVDKLGFIYFRFNFKMTSKGWVLADFRFKSESKELLPKDFP
jgi:hypothetical protein